MADTHEKPPELNCSMSLDEPSNAHPRDFLCIKRAPTWRTHLNCSPPRATIIPERRLRQKCLLRILGGYRNFSVFGI